MNMILFTAKTQSALSFFSFFAEAPKSENHQPLRVVMISLLKSQKPNFYFFAAQLLSGFPLSPSLPSHSFSDGWSATKEKEPSLRSLRLERSGR
jgi:hypothetical protein